MTLFRSNDSGSDLLPPARRFRSWLPGNVFATLFFPPLGIPGLVFSFGALKARRRGDLALADYRAKSARGFFWFAIVLGLATIVYYLGLATFPSSL